MGLAGLFWVITGSLAGAAVGGSWGRRTELDLLGGADLASHVAAILTVAAVLGHILAPLAASHRIGVRAAFRAGRDMPPAARDTPPVPAHRGRHAREPEPATDPYENVTWLRHLRKCTAIPKGKFP
jgi:hypothetical protein